MNPQLLERWRWAHDRLQQGQAAEAIHGWEGVLMACPGHVPTLLWLGRAHALAGHYRQARECALAAHAQRPQAPQQQHELITQLRSFYEVQAVLECVSRIEVAQWTDLAALADIATQLVTIEAHAQALLLVDAILQRQPDLLTAVFLRATLHMFYGEVDAAEQAFERAMTLAPELPSAHWTLSQLRKATPNRNHVPRLQQALARATTADARAYLDFALHIEWHDLGRHEESWAALERGCRTKRQQIQYDRAENAALFDAVASLCDAEFCRSGLDPDPHAPAPIFVVGMHRSGTTLLEQILGGHSRISDAGETYTFPAQLRLAADLMTPGALSREIVRRLANADFAAIGRNYVAAARPLARGRSYFTEKLPSNFLNIGFIAKALPRAKFLHMVRDPRDVCFSNLRTLFSGVNGYSYDQIELAEYYARYRQLMAHWHEVAPGRVLDVSYARLVSDSETAAREVMDFLGLAFEPEQLAIERRSGTVATASSVQVRYGIRPLGTPAWKPYEARLQPLFEALSPYLSTFDPSATSPAA